MGHDRGPEGSGKIAQRISRVPLVVVVVVVVVSVCTCGDNTPFWYLSFGESSRAGCPMQRGFELANLTCRCLHAKFKDRHYHWPGLPRIDVIDCLVWCDITFPPTRFRWFLVSMPRLSGTVGNVLSKVLSLLRKVVRYHAAARRHIVTVDTTLPCGIIKWWNLAVVSLTHSFLVAWPGCGVGAVFGAVAAAVNRPRLALPGSRRIFG